MTQGLTLLGATGSIGASTLDVVARHPGRFRVFALTAHRAADALLALCLKHAPRYAVLSGLPEDAALRRRYAEAGCKSELLFGAPALEQVAADSDCDVLMAAIVGAAGLAPALAGARAGKRLLLANKEALVMAGPFFMRAVRERGATLLPIDSEHNAVFQCLPQEAAQSSGRVSVAAVRRILLTASGGPFRAAPLERLSRVTPDEACAHPNWVMGRKISVDSATMMNKGLEVIEARWLFDVPPERIEVLIHSQSIIHSLVEFVDGSVIAQLSNPDMRVPIAHALGFPERIHSGATPLDLAAIGQLSFERPDAQRFPCLGLAYAALREGGTAPAVLNAANEVAVAAFLEGRLRYTAIPQVIEQALARSPAQQADSLDGVLEADRNARRVAAEAVALLMGEGGMSFLHTALSFVVALGVLIIVHEYGHYLAARLCDVKVLRFSVGFGRSLYTRRIGPDATEWTVAAIPFGGYVKMLDEREAPVDAKEQHRAFNRQSVARRFVIVIAGPLFNFLFAIAVYAGLYMYGMPEARPVLAQPAAGTLARTAEFAAGDTVRSIEGEPVATWQDLRWRVLQGALQKEALRFEVAGARGDISMHVLDLRDYPPEEVESDTLERIGLRLFRPPLDPVLGRVVAGSAAERAGLRSDDRVTHAGGEPVASWEALVQAVRAHPATVLPLTVERAGTQLRIDVLPDAVAENGARIGRIGAAPRIPAADAERIVVRVRYGPLDSLAKAVAKTWDISVFSLKMLGKMLVGEISWKHLSGPVTIADYAGQSAQMGWLAYATFLALISISLGVLNLLPIPLLDGGHLMYYLVEIIKGSPVSERAMELGQRVGLALLLVVMAFAFYNDINRLFSG